MSQAANRRPEDAIERNAAAGPVFAALADPTRRHILSVLSEGSTATASQLATDLPISRQAIAKHLQALAEAGLVKSSHQGRETLYRLTPKPLSDAMQWIAATGALWDARLERLAERLSEER